MAEPKAKRRIRTEVSTVDETADVPLGERPDAFVQHSMRAPVGGRFIEERLLGVGAMGAVHQAFDRETGERVALKRLFHMDAYASLRLKREFRSLADVSHENLVRLYELGQDEEGWFLVMEYVDGETLDNHLARLDQHRLNDTPDGAQSDPSQHTSRTMELFRQLASGVQALHAVELLHRDLKPSNVMVSKDRVVVLDFGMVREVESGGALTERGALAGTPAYMAPEQACGDPLSKASDWYSVGVMLYESLAGRRPFEGSAVDVLRAKLESHPTPLRLLRPDIPLELEVVCMGLLAREARRRPTEAEVLGAFEHAVDDPSAKPGQAGRRTSNHPPRQVSSMRPLVGRERELKELWSAMEEADDGRLSVVHVVGESGVGKSALVEQFLAQIEARNREGAGRGALLLQSRCYEREAMPFKALDGIVDALCAHLFQLSDVEVGNTLPTDVDVLARVFPSLGRLRAVRQLSARRLALGDALDDRRRAEEAMCDLLLRLSRTGPVVIWIDDLHWGDLDSARLLNVWLRRLSSAPVLLIVGYRADELQTSECLGVLLGDGGHKRPRHHVHLKPLGHDDVVRLCHVGHEEVGLESAATIEHIARESQGSPFLAVRLMALAAAKRTRGDADLETISVRSLITQTSALLPDDGRRLLEALAIAGRPIGLKLALRAAEVRDGRSATHELHRLQLIRIRETRGERLVEIYHDRIRARAYDLIDKSERQRIAGALLGAAEDSGSTDADWLHALALEAGDTAAAFRYGVTAAEKATSGLAFEHGAGLYGVCLALPQGQGEERAGLHIRLARALSCCGRGELAARAYLDAAKYTKGSKSLRLLRSAMFHLMQVGRFAEGESLADDVLRASGLHAPRSQIATTATVLLWQWSTRLRKLRWKERQAADVPSDVLMQIDVLRELASTINLVDPMRASYFLVRQAQLAFSAGEPARVMHALCGVSYFVASAGTDRALHQALGLLDEAEEIASKIGKAPGRAWLLCTRAAVYLAVWRPREALDPAREAERICDSLGEDNSAEAYTIRFNIAATRIGALHGVGDLPAFELKLSQSLARARETENRAALLHLALNETLYDELVGDIDNAVARLSAQRADLPKSSFGALHVLHMAAVLTAARASQRFDWGMEILDEDWPRFLASPVRYAKFYATIARVVRVQFLINLGLVRGDGARGISRHLREVRSLERSPACPLTRAFGLTTRARLALSEGRVAAGRKYFELARAETEWETTVPRCDTVLGLVVGGIEGAGLVDIGARRLRGQGVRDPVSFVLGHYPELRSRGL